MFEVVPRTEVYKIVAETLALLENKDEYQKMAQAKNPYGDGKAAGRIASILLDQLKQ